jgi:hypothetical protein
MYDLLGLSATMLRPCPLWVATILKMLLAQYDELGRGNMNGTAA